MLSSSCFDSVEVTRVIFEDSHSGGTLIAVDGYFTSNVMKGIPIGQGQRSSSCGHSADIRADAGTNTGNGNSQEYQAVTEGAGICVKSLPPNAIIALVENVFKQFGPIKKGGTRVRNPASNYWYGFVEFEEADAAKRAIKASPLRINGHTAYVEKKRPAPLRIDVHATYVEKKRPSPLRIDGHTAYVEKKRPYNKESGYGESPSAGPGNINRGEEVGGSLGNPYWNWQKMMEEVRGTDVWQKLMMGSRGTEVYDIRNWEKILEEEQMKFQEEQGRQHNQNRYRSEELRGTEGVGLDLEKEAKEENQNWENLAEEQGKIQEDEGRQYNQNRYEQMKETLTGGLGQIVEEEEEEDQN